VPAILIVDDNKPITDLLEMILEEDSEREFSIAKCYSGQEALEIIELQKPDFIISDIKMAPMNGIELLHRVRAIDEKIPFIFMTGFADLILIDEAIKIGANDLIIKPFDGEAILELIERYLPITENEKKKARDDDYCKIDLNKFISGKEIPCSLFIKIREDHYVKLANKGDPIPVDKLLEYKEKKLKFLHVLKDEYCEFVGFNLQILKALEKNNKIDNTKVANFINYTNSILQEKTILKDLDQSDVEEIKAYTDMTLSLLKKRTTLLILLKGLADSSEYAYAHALSTAILSYLIAKEVEWDAEPTLFKVFLSGLLHDTGLKEVDKEIITKNPALFNDTEKEEYEGHTTRGMEILNAAGGLPEEVILSAYQHHEDCLGKGYPLGINKQKITPISRLIACADIIDDRLIGTKELSLSHYRSSLEQILRYKKAHYDSKFLQALCTILKVDF